MVLAKSSGRRAVMLGTSIAVVATAQQKETVMLKYLSICAALVALGVTPAYAQEREAALQRVQVPGMGFDIVLATPHPEGGAVPNLANTPETLVMHLHGGKLALVFDDPWELVKAYDSLRTPVGAFEASIRNGNAPEPIALYIVPKGDTLVPSRNASKTQSGSKSRRPSLVSNATMDRP